MLSATAILALAFVLGAAFGLLCARTRFCTLGAVADIVVMADWRRMGMWLLAIAVAIAGSAALHAAGLIDLDKTIYRTPKLLWAAHLVGGLAFGVGMALASGCAGKTLILIGSGSIKALIVFLALCAGALMSMYGILSVLRIRVLNALSLPMPGGSDLPALLTGFGVPASAALAIAAGGLVIALLAFIFLRAGRLSAEQLAGGAGAGLLVVAGWLLSGHFGYVAEDPDTLQEAFLATRSGRMESLSFVAGQADLMSLLTQWSDNSQHPDFAIAVALGVVAGSAAHALATGSFRWEGFHDLEDSVHHLLGGVLMGFGAVTALGCSIGQGISGVSTLALGSLLTLPAIISGAAATLVWQLRRAD
ncbi:YeeE/YedE family protein [Rhodocyclus tenuis]|uniref:YeeE/YedE family protein n=1 Tax=Rhodocyclus tenuis TaxID=1066 RepID=A0A840G1Y7_RHOTE|nr:YeeE/YedE family protein [Rhodocyclus tenuis]MBB4246433.1 hypothetical protein [Rhodocyclus tenuis]